MRLAEEKIEDWVATTIMGWKKYGDFYGCRSDKKSRVMLIKDWWLIDSYQNSMYLLRRLMIFGVVELSQIKTKEGQRILAKMEVFGVEFSQLHIGETLCGLALRAYEKHPELFDKTPYYFEK